MSSISDSSDASADDASNSDDLPVFRTLEEEQAKRRKKRKNYGAFQGLKFFDLSEKQKQREREKLREELKDVIAEQAEIEKYEIKTEPFVYRTRESSLSPHTPPGRPEREEVGLQDTLQDVSLPGTSMSGTVCDDRQRKAIRVVYRYKYSSDSSSRDDEDTAPSQERAPVLRNRGSPPSADAADGGAGGWDTSDTDAGGRPSVTLAEVPTSARTLSFNDSGKGFQVPRASVETAPSASPKKPILRRKGREGLQRERSLYRSWSDRRSSSADSSSSQEGGEGRPPLAAPRRRASGDAGLTPLSTLYKRLSSRRGNSPATTHPEGGDAEHAPAQLTTPASRQRESVRRLSLLSSGSGLREVARPSSGGSAFSVWHSTPVFGAPRAMPSPTGSDGVHGSSRQMFAAGVDRLLDGKQRRQALDRGDVRVELSITAPGRQASAAGSAHDTGQPDTAQQGTGDSQRRRRTRGSLQRGRPSSDSSRLSTAHRSIVVRIGQGWSRERVLVSNAPSVTSAIASFCEELPQLLSASGAPYHMEPEDMLNQLLKLCGQERPVTFDEVLRLGRGRRASLVVRKLGEGSEGEVYRVRRGPDESVLKVIPVGGNQIVDGLKPQSLVGASAEVVIARELSNLRINATNRTANFIAMNGAHCVQGPYHPVLLASWKEYEERFCSENENPEIFDDEQLFLILDFEYGGKPLEKFKGSAEQLESVFVQVSCSLAAAELALRFEHRDLHGDNVLVRHTAEEHATYALQGTELRVPTAGVWASVIDYTLSRISKGTEAEYAATGRTAAQSVLFTDLALDSQLFRGSGSYQYDIYRLMRDRNGNDWQAYEPFTNVLWLDYLARKLLAKRPRSLGGAPPPLCARLAEWQAQLPSFSSAGAFVTQCLLLAPSPVNRKRRKEPASPAPGHRAMAGGASDC